MSLITQHKKIIQNIIMSNTQSLIKPTNLGKQDICFTLVILNFFLSA